MKSAFTLNDLILFAFNDTLDSDEDHCAVQSETVTAAAKEWKCIFELEPFGISGAFLLTSPAINPLLAYSRSLEVYHTKVAGTVFKVLN